MKKKMRNVYLLITHINGLFNTNKYCHEVPNSFKLTVQGFLYILICLVDAKEKKTETPEQKRLHRIIINEAYRYLTTVIYPWFIQKQAEGLFEDYEVPNILEPSLA